MLVKLRIGIGIALVALIAGTIGLGVSAPQAAHAYGKADNPIAQIEISGNCTSPVPGACDQFDGTRGIWLWIELDTGGTGDVAGAGCGHTIGGGGAGGGPIRDEVTWQYVSSPGLPPLIDPSGSYYEITLPDGEVFVVPTTVGHYKFNPFTGLQLQVQVAP